jgi:hypothetical protein
MKKNIDLLNNNVGNIAHSFSVQHKIKLIGSNATRGMLFPSDFDFESKLSGRAEALFNEFKKIFKNKKLMSKIYFMDFKCGLDNRLYPFNINNPLIPAKMKKKIMKAKDKEKLERELYIIRWTPAEVIRGYKVLFDGTHKSFVDCLEDDTTIKLDWIIPIGNAYMECSTNYYYKQSDVSNQVKELTEEIDYYKYNNTMKAMKRLMSILVLTNRDKRVQKKLVAYFNSPIGYINKIKNDMELLVELTEKHEIPFQRIYNNIQMLKEKLGNTDLVSTPFVLGLNKINASNYKRKIKKAIDFIQKVINDVSKNMLGLI